MLTHATVLATYCELRKCTITLQQSLTDSDYYQDVMLTGWPLPSSRYTRKIASSTIPTALMNRLPVLLSTKEARAYDYLRSPAILEIRKNEMEIQALARLRRTNSCSGGTAAQWERLEQKITIANRRMLEKLLLRKQAPT